MVQIFNRVFSLPFFQVDNGGQKVFVFALKPFYQPADSEELKPTKTGIIFGNFAPHLPESHRLPIARVTDPSKPVEITSDELMAMVQQK